MSSAGRWLVVCHTERGEIHRVISAREMTKFERNIYEEDRSVWIPINPTTVSDFCR
jgi:uncharacterized DUF497 family protein